MSAWLTKEHKKEFDKVKELIESKFNVNVESMSTTEESIDGMQSIIVETDMPKCRIDVFSIINQHFLTLVRNKNFKTISSVIIV